jgi:hypothetical protein
MAPRNRWRSVRSSITAMPPVMASPGARSGAALSEIRNFAPLTFDENEPTHYPSHPANGRRRAASSAAVCSVVRSKPSESSSGTPNMAASRSLHSVRRRASS